MTELLRLPITNATTGNCFTLTLSVGNPAVPIEVLLDTGSSMLTVNADPYQRDADQAAATSALLHNGSFQGSTFLAAVIRTQIGLAAAEPAAAVTVPNANLGVVYKVKPFLFGKADGILGLAYNALSPASQMPADTWENRYEPTQLALGRPAGNLPTYLDQLVTAARLANKFAFAVRRSVSSKAGDGSSDVLNAGILVLGGGEECSDLYTGEFSSVAVVHEAYYNTNLIAIEVGARSVAVPPTPAGNPAVSNSFIDSANSGLMLDPPLYNQVIGLFNAIDPAFGQALQAPGCDQTRLDLANWPTLRFVLQAANGAQATIAVQPKDYWQFDGYGAGTATTGLASGGAPHPGQSILGLPLFAGHYVVFDRTQGPGSGVVKFAERPATNAPPLIA